VCAHRAEKGKTWTLWSTQFSSWPDRIELKDGKLVGPNQYRTCFIDPLTGTSESVEKK
jgi:hypothetical protein